MPQLMRSARKALDQIRADMADINEAKDLAIKEALDQHYVKDRMHEISAALGRLERRLSQDVEPLLERQAPQYEQRLAKLEAQMQELLAELTITPVREHTKHGH